MISVKDKAENAISLKVDGKLAHEDYQKFVPMLEEIIKEHGSVRVCMEIANFHGITPHGLWDEMKFDVTHCKEIERCAVIGEKTSHKWMTKLGGLIFYKAELKYFDISEADQAWDWVCEGGEKAPCACEKKTETA